MLCLLGGGDRGCCVPRGTTTPSPTRPSTSPLQWKEWVTHARENITFARFATRAVKMTKSENRCWHCLLFRVRFSVLSFKNYYFSPLKGSTHWCLCWTINIYLKQSISFLSSKEIQLALFSATLYAMWPLQCNSLGEFHLILQTGETLPDSRLLLQMIYMYS